VLSQRRQFFIVIPSAEVLYEESGQTRSLARVFVLLPHSATHFELEITFRDITGTLKQKAAISPRTATLVRGCKKAIVEIPAYFLVGSRHERISQSADRSGYKSHQIQAILH
jgi:hypothetical protein